MKRFFALVTLVVLTLSLVLRAETPDEMFVKYYQALQSAENLLSEGREQPALDQYLEAEVGLKKLQEVHPQWNSKVVQYRLRYLAEKIKPLAAKYPKQVREAQKAAPPPKKAGPAGPVDGELSRLNDQLIDMRIEKAMLEKKLAEALAARPATVDPKELAKAEEQIKQLRQDNDLLKVTVEQDKQKMAGLVDAKVVEQTRKELTEVNKQLSQNAAKMASLTKENESLQQRLQTATRSSELLALRSENSTLKKQTADLGKQAAASTKLEAALQETREQTAALKRESEALKNTLKQEQRRTARMIESTAVDSLKQELTEVSRRLADQAGAMAKAEARGDKLSKELAALQQTSDALKRDNASLKDSLKQAGKGAGKPADSAELARVKKDLAEASQKLSQQATAAARAGTLEQQLKQARADLQAQESTLAALRKDNAKMEKLLTDPGTTLHAPSTKPDSGLEKDLKAAQEAKRKSESTLAALQKEKADLERENRDLQARLKSAASGTKSNPRDEAKIKALMNERDRLQNELRAATKEAASRKERRDMAKIETMADELAGLRARLEVLEAKKTPYSKEELALFKKPASAPAMKENKTASTSTKAMPTSAGKLIAEAQQDFRARRFNEAEKKYTEVLRRNENNVETLVNLAVTQIEQDHLAEAEGNLKKALSVSPNDGGALSQYGYLKFRQGKLDEALDHLGRAAQVEPKNADVQVHLGVVLSEKGQRGAAEAALRKAIQLEPGNGDAHQNLAVIYATQNPPLPELARWHYQKALAAGRSRNAELEKMIDRK